MKTLTNKETTKNAISKKVETKEVIINNCKLPLTTKQNIIIFNLLEHQVVSDGNGGEIKMGLSYQEVLERTLNMIKQSPLFDENTKTSMNCVRWYSSKIKNESLKYYQKDSLGIIRGRMSTSK